MKFLPTRAPQARPQWRLRIVSAAIGGMLLGAPLWAQQEEPDAPPAAEQAQPPEQDEQREDRPRRQPDEQPQQAEQRGALGVLLGEADAEGVLVRGVARNSAAAEAGIRPGDRIASVNDQKVASPQDLSRSIERMNPGDQVTLGVIRDGRRMNVEATLVAQAELGLGQPEQPRRDQPQATAEERDANRAWLGVMLRDPQDGQEQEGAAVAQVYPSGPAARAGLRSGDVIIGLADQEVSNLDDLYEAMEGLEPNEEITVQVRRNGEEQELTARLASRADFVGDPQEFRGFRPPDEQEGRFDRFSNMPEHSLMLEQHRRLVTQHQRLEELLSNVLEEVKALREEVRRLQGNESPANE
ncbi:MAG: PDZ domain-containing protein [Planctomycetes bacterium]|nr:PDZ domain-containing protein [Planctomycetota bacterium]